MPDVTSRRRPVPQAARRTARRLAGRVARRLGLRRPRRPLGAVVRFVPPIVEGWIAVPPGAPAVSVMLRVNDLDVVTTRVADPAAPDRYPLARERNPGAEIRRFRFLVNGLWKYVGPADRISIVTADGTPLRINGHGPSYQPEKQGALPLAELKAKLAEGYVFSRTGWLQKSLNLDVDWQRRTMIQSDRVRAAVQEQFGYEPFFVYGSLLGAVREGGPIAHDSDLDLSYVSKHRSGEQAAEELREIAFALIERGFRVRAYRTHLRIANEIEGTADVHVDLFHTYFDTDGILRFPYGVAGVGDLHESEWEGVHEVPFGSGRGPVPVAGEKLARVLYGDGWREPQPGFNWNRDRKTRASDALLPEAAIEEIYWADFYEHTEYDTGSTFFDYLQARDDLPATVLDIGCGDGRDSFAHAKAGRQVFGLDRSHIGIRHATGKAAKLSLDDKLTFRPCDVGDAAALTEALAAVRSGAGGGAVLFYLRFFLHSIPEEVQETLLQVIDAEARAGDLFAAEFRTLEDERAKKVHTHHYRRYQDGRAFGARLRDQFGFELLDEVEGTGLSPYKGEDPHLYRVVARRTR